MPYYPKSQVKTSLYTNGTEYVLVTTREMYKGYYYLTSTGRKYTGKSPTNSPTTEIVLISELAGFSPQATESPFAVSFEPAGTEEPKRMSFSSAELVRVSDYSTLSSNPQFDPSTGTIPYTPPNQVYSNRYIPTYSPVLPTLEDFENGYFTRYFCKKNNELKYIEINKSFFTKLSNQDKDVAWDLYTPTSIQWQLTGDTTQVHNSNLSSVSYIESTQGWLGFPQYFKNNFTKYYDKNPLTTIQPPLTNTSSPTTLPPPSVSIISSPSPGPYQL